LLAMEGSLVGWGTDIGGSIRIPSLMNGLYGLKPSVSLPTSFLSAAFLYAILEHMPMENLLTFSRALDFHIKEFQFPQRVKNMYLLQLAL